MMPLPNSCVILFALVLAAPAQALDKISFATNWRAQAEHGGFYQALVDGTYARYGLDVTIAQGGPQLNARLLLAAGRVDFAMGANTIQMFESVQQNVPIVTVASLFQIDPVIFMSHPGEGLDRFEDLPKATAFIANDMRVSVWQWLKQAYGFKDEKTKPYNFNSAPFIADKKSIQQGFLTSEPYEIERQGGFKPNVFLLARLWLRQLFDDDRSARRNDRKKSRSRAALRRRLDHRLVQLHLRRQCARQCDDQTRQSRDDRRPDRLFHRQDEGARHRRFGDALTLGVGVMTDARMKSFFDKMAKAGVVPADLDYRRGYTLRFIGKKIGMELRPK